MKLNRYLALAAVAGALLSFGQASFAQSADTTANTGKTRAEVRADLVQAEAQGVIPGHKTDYPPSPQQIAQNRATYQARHLDNRVNMAFN
ncbi:DUF4148 domain-containing protein [Paraburkholderia sp.]|uniref:DUF4148 domain-containing protein n=1 Tax=Paraburkholderia sp. TaxID=1926495 RepID=UPI002F3FFA31